LSAFGLLNSGAKRSLGRICRLTCPANVPSRAYAAEATSGISFGHGGEEGRVSSFAVSDRSDYDRIIREVRSDGVI
jgi:hypothetical protein